MIVQEAGVLSDWRNKTVCCLVLFSIRNSPGREPVSAHQLPAHRECKLFDCRFHACVEGGVFRANLMQLGRSQPQRAES